MGEKCKTDSNSNWAMCGKILQRSRKETYTTKWGETTCKKCLKYASEVTKKKLGVYNEKSKEENR